MTAVLGRAAASIEEGLIKVALIEQDELNGGPGLGQASMRDTQLAVIQSSLLEEARLTTKEKNKVKALGKLSLLKFSQSLMTSSLPEAKSFLNFLYKKEQRAAKELTRMEDELLALLK